MALPVKNITRTTFIPRGSVEHIVAPAAAANRKMTSSIDLMGISSLLPGYLVVRNPEYPFHVLLMIRRGVLRFRDRPETQAGGEREFSAGSMLFLPARSWYMYGADAPLELIWFHLYPEAADWQFLKGVRRIHDTAVDLECLRSLVSVLYRESNGAERQDSGISQHGIRLVELLLHRILNRFAPESESAAKLRTLFDVVELSLERPWSVAAMARQAGISPSALFALSRENFGVSPMAHLHELRMNAAANLLRNTTYKLDAIASMVGLGCGFSLSRAFRRFHGISPREFRRKSNRQNSPLHNEKA